MKCETLTGKSKRFSEAGKRLCRTAKRLLAFMSTKIGNKTIQPSGKRLVSVYGLPNNTYKRLLNAKGVLLNANNQSKRLVNANETLNETLNDKPNAYTNASAMADYLQTIDWKRFCTFTTPYELTLPSLRRMMVKFQNRMTTNVFNQTNTWHPYYKYPHDYEYNVSKDLAAAEHHPILFWVGEKFECKDGYHGHGLLWYGDDWLPSRCDELEILDECYQNTTASRKWICEHDRTDIKKFRVQFSRYNKKKAAARYCSKYLCKRYADYDLFS